jgi:hypothetical protein
MGFLISLSSFGAFADLLLGYPFRFAVLYSLGNLTSLGSTMFLVGPVQQFKNMIHRKRRVSAAIYTIGLVLTLVTAFLAPELSWLILILVIVQWSALFWYSLSYIPFGRRMATGIANRLLVYTPFYTHNVRNSSELPKFICDKFQKMVRKLYRSHYSAQ